MSATYTQTIGATASDGHTYASVYFYTATTNAGRTDDSREAFFLFTNVSIEPGNIIISATLKLTCYDSESGTTVRLLIYGNDVDNATAPTSAVDHNNKVRTSASVAWSPDAWTANNEYTSPDFAVVIQEIIDRAGWSNGNSILVLLDDNSSDTNAVRPIYDYSQSAAKAAELTILHEPFVAGNVLITP